MNESDASLSGCAATSTMNLPRQPNGQRVLMVTSEATLNLDNGPDLQALNAANTLGFETTLLVTSREQPIEEAFAMIQSEPIAAYGLSSEQLSDDDADVEFATFVRDHQFDLVHFIDPISELPHFFIERCFYSGVPAVVSVVGESGIGTPRQALVERVLGLSPIVHRIDSVIQAVCSYSDMVGSVSVPQTDMTISAIIITYNRAEMLRECIDSFLYQTLPQDKFEIIVVDDCSDVSPEPIVESYKSRLPISFVRHDVNKGIGEARNTGVERAQGEVVLYMDDDDVLAPRALAEALRSHAENPNPMVAVLAYLGWDPRLKINNVMRHVTTIGQQYVAYVGLDHNQRLPWMFAWGGAASLKTSVVREHRYNTRWLEDIELAWRLKSHGLEVVLNSHCVHYVTDPIDFDRIMRRQNTFGRYEASLMQMHPGIEFMESIVDVEKMVRELEPKIPSLKAIIQELNHCSRAELAARPSSVSADNTQAQELDNALYLVFFHERLKAFQEAQQQIIQQNS